MLTQPQQGARDGRANTDDWREPGRVGRPSARCGGAAGPEPEDGIWGFNLKGATDDPVRRSFALRLPTAAGAAALFRRFAADAAAGRPTRVRVSGRLHGFSAPTKARQLVGLHLVLGSSRGRRAGPA
jgi:hypothetical protein